VTARVAQKIEVMPMEKWSSSAKGLVRFEDGRFWMELAGPESAAEAELRFACTREVAVYRLHGYFERRGLGFSVAGMEGVVYD
jgi:hypothetical protein